MRIDHWPVVHAERRALAQQLAQIGDKKAWDTPSLCPGWTVHDVLAHLVNDATTTPARFALQLLRARFDFDALNRAGVETEKGPSAAETLRRFSAVTDRSTSAPAPAATRLVEVIVHGEDIRRPLGLRHEYPVFETVVALKYQLKTAVSMGGGRERARGLTLRADGSGFRHGAGPDVAGSPVALLLAVSGRAVAPDELTGPGALQLRTAS